MDRADWQRRLETEERRLGLTGGFKLVYAPWSTLLRPETVFLSLNPGRAPAKADLRTVSDERGVSYVVERETTRSPITSQFLGMADFLGVDAERIVPGTVMPFRSGAWTDLTKAQRSRGLALGREFWTEVLCRSTVRMVVAVSAEATAMAVDILGATLVRSVPAGWGNVSVHRYETPAGTTVVQLPHLSRFRLFGRPASEAALNLVFEQGGTPAPSARAPAPSVTAPRPTQRAEDPSLRTALQEVSRPVADYFERLSRETRYSVDPMRMQIAVSFDGRKVGGFNRRIG